MSVTIADLELDALEQDQRELARVRAEVRDIIAHAGDEAVSAPWLRGRLERLLDPTITEDDVLILECVEGDRVLLGGVVYTVGARVGDRVKLHHELAGRVTYAKRTEMARRAP